ncbi:MBL fold metallo-hydrolase, partial [Candidatus Bathyarchaeota archaeon]|nr:MBL fold metallo-hydrolase [Candidatus Bathyarchaeota archaeon]
VGYLSTNCYIVSCEESQEAVIIDPGLETEKEAEIILSFINENDLKIKYIINTHGHPDHISGNAYMKQVTGAPILIHENHMGKANQDRKLCEGDEIKVGNFKLVVIHTPGHTKSGICLLGDSVVFTGDTLFAGSIGRTDFPGGSFQQIINSIKTKLLILPESFKVYPGHESFSTIGNEKKHNPFLQD